MTRYYWIVGDRSNPWIHAHTNNGWFHLDPEHRPLQWFEGKIDPVGRRMSRCEVSRMKLPKRQRT